MKLQTIVDIKLSEWKIGYEDKILLVGSCFADSIGQMMEQRGLQVTCNPFGTLYNPLSIAQALSIQPSAVSYQFHDGLWHSMSHHGSFSRANKEEAEQAVKASIDTMQRAFEEATVVIVTFGTAWVYEWKDAAWLSGSGASPVVANCHKLPENCFTRRRLSADEIVQTWQPIVAQYPDKHWLFTVSPIRHIKDGLHENQLSKATLLLALEAICHQLSAISYFPSYEIALDELRDYRFYAEDLVHPSPVAIQYIWERFIEAYCTPQTRNEMTLRLKEWKHEHHIPLH
jgi:hypothetical protein